VHPLVKGAVGVAFLSALAPPPARPATTVREGDAVGSAIGEPGAELRCPARSAPVDDASGRARCVELPDDPRGRGARARRLAAMPPTIEHLRTTSPNDFVPRLPDRPEDYGAYLLPVEPLLRTYAPEPPSAYDEQPKHGVYFATSPGSPVTLADLDEQQGDAEVLLVGELYGVTVVLRQRAQIGPSLRDYLVFYGELARPGPGVVSGAKLGPAAVVGYLPGGDDAALYYEVRQQQAEMSRPLEHLSQLARPSLTVSIDPRNVLRRTR
jgi:hypothetical protein